MSYVSVVTDFFSTRQGRSFSFSPEDYAAIAEWEKQEIPLSFVLDTIERVISESEKRSEPVESITQINGSIHTQFANWLRGAKAVADH
jgi:hypothetical protein